MGGCCNKYLKIWMWFCNWVIGNERVLRCMLERAYLVVNRPLKAVLVKTQKEKRRAVGKASSSWRILK